MSRSFTLSVALVCLVSSKAVAVPVSDGSILFDDFTGAAGPLTTASPNWDQIDGTITLDGTTLATHGSDLGGVVGGRSKLLDFSGSPDEWVATARFQINGTLNTVASGGAPRQYHLLSGSTNRSPLGTEDWESIGFDLRAEEVSGDTTGTGLTFDLTWFGWDNIDSARVTSAVAGGAGLDKDELYTVTLHRKSDDMIDIYLDDSLIDTKPLLVGSGGGSVPGLENPRRLQFGDFSSLIAADVTIDYFSIGAVQTVPEPSTSLLVALGLFAMMKTRRSRRELSCT